MEKQIVWSESAIRDIRDIYHYISSDSRFYADRVLDQIIDRVETLISFPMHGRTTPELNNPSIREIFVKQYRVIYKVDEEVIVIHAIIHMARDSEELLKNQSDL